MTSFSEKLKELRKKNNLTQQELADKVGTNRVNVTKWETGRTEPTLENIVKLSKILDTTTDELLGRNINFRDTILNKKYKYDLSVLKESDTQNLYDLKITLAEAVGETPAVTLNYGVFIQNVFDFIIIAFAIFMMIKGINKVKKPVEEVKGPSQEELLTEIRDLLKKQ